MGKPGSLSRRLGQGKSGIDEHFFNKVQLLDLENNEVEEDEKVEDVELEDINVATLEKKNGL